MARGYHGVVHQIGCEPQCPVHGLWLETECPGCGATTDYRIDVRLLDAPFRCAHCRRSYAPTRTSFVSRPPLSKRARSSIVRMFIGVGNAPGRPLNQRAER
jgi:predicted RNA-binding Zn-ribbon protein involved in translation (DUF1610 family)